MKKMKIIYEDQNLLVIDKEPHQLTIATQKHEQNTLYNEASTYIKKQYPKNKIFIVHRLDKDTSGLIVFAKNQDIKNYLQNNWSQVKREYICIVEGQMPKKKDILKSYLAESKTFQVYSTKDKTKGKLAITEYEVLQTNKKYSLLKIKIKTGRKNQIRVQLADINHPILGDKKYNSSSLKKDRLYLHANLLEFKIKDKSYHFISEYPKTFLSIFKDLK